jgi:hypothetical protein
MPKTPMDYSNTVIYKLVCNDLNVTDCYVGHTTNFVKRKYGHKLNCHTEYRKHYHLKVYQTIRANGGWENWSMIQIEAYPCNSLQEATARERYYYELLKPTMNHNCPGRSATESQKEYYKINAETIRAKQAQYSKEYYKINYETIRAKYNCECGGRYTHGHRARHFDSAKHKKYIEELTKEN